MQNRCFANDYCILPYIIHGIYTMLTEKEFLDIISKIIHKHRNIKKLSCEKLAELSEVDYSSLNLIENGKQTPRSYTLYKILYSLDIDIIDKIYPTNNSTADLLINKIKLLDEASQKDLLTFLDGFQLKTK